MDDIEYVDITKQSTFLLMCEAHIRGWEICYIKHNDLFLRNAKACAIARSLKVVDDNVTPIELSAANVIELDKLQVIFMRKDPPFDLDYLYATYVLEQAERGGALVVNRPQSLRDANEKLFASRFAECCPPTLVASSEKLLKEFLDEHKDIILKPLFSMAGDSIFRVRSGDDNVNVIIETMTNNGKQAVMAQKFIKEIASGDKRILLINGEAVPYAVARIPSDGDIRGSLARGATAKIIPLTKRDMWICNQIAQTLVEKGLLFVGIDVIGDYLTEINVTSPTGLNVLEKMHPELKLTEKFFDVVEGLV